jgi:hypothetical protein
MAAMDLDGHLIDGVLEGNRFAVYDADGKPEYYVLDNNNQWNTRAKRSFNFDTLSSD